MMETPVTLNEILRLSVFRGARVVAGHRGLPGRVRWCHVSEVLDIARLLSGGELLLTTGLALDVPADRQAAYIKELKQGGVAGLMLELGRKFQEAPPAVVEAAERAGLPFVTLPFDTPFVKVTEAVHAIVLARQADGTAGDMQPHQALLADIWAGRVPDVKVLKARVEALGWTLPGQLRMTVLAVGGEAPAEAVRAGAAAELGRNGWLFGTARGEGQLLAFGSDRAKMVDGLRALARRLAPAPAGVGLGFANPSAAARSLAEARQTMRLRRTRPQLSPLFAETGVYRLALDRSPEELQQFVSDWLEPLLHYDRVHRTDLCGTLRVLLDDRLVVAEAAKRLHLTRQGLYHRQQRLAELLGHDLDEQEVRMALSVALRFHDVLLLDEGDGAARALRHLT